MPKPVAWAQEALPQGFTVFSLPVMMSSLIADQSSAQRHSPPEWYIDRGFTFGEVTSGRYYDPMDKPDALSHLIDVYIAFVREYGKEERLHGIVLGEYFPSFESVEPRLYDRLKLLDLPKAPFTARSNAPRKWFPVRLSSKVQTKIALLKKTTARGLSGT